MEQHKPPQAQPVLSIPSFSLAVPDCASDKTSNFSPASELQIYKSEYHRLLRENSQLLAQLNKVIQEKAELECKYNNLQVESGSHEDKKKRVRRTANEIVRQFDCNMPRCSKSYGTEASLLQHIKLKHPQAYQTKQYQYHLAELRSRAETKGLNNLVATIESHNQSSSQNK